MDGRDPLIVVDIVVPEAELVRRLATRMVCEKCGDDGRDRRGGRGPARRASGAAGGSCSAATTTTPWSCERLEGVPRQTQPLVEYYRARPTFRSVDGAQAPDRVAADLAAAIDAAGSGVADEGAAAVIVCRSAAELERMREAGRLVGEVLTELAAHVAPGVTTADLDALAEKRILAAGATPAFKGYHGYPATICASINDEVIHGIPSGRRVLNEGDIISIDVGASLDGYFGDSAITLPVGQVSEEAATLLRVTEESLYKAIERVRPGGRVSDIGHAVQQHVEAYGFSVVREFVGHGIGQKMHEEPQVPNYGEPGRGPRLAEGMVLAIEPMVNAGKPAVKVLADGWTAVTRDGSLSAHFEHTVAVTAGEPWILTAREVARFAGHGRVSRAVVDRAAAERAVSGEARGRAVW